MPNNILLYGILFCKPFPATLQANALRFPDGILSIAKNRQGGVEFAAPTMAIDALKAALLPSHVAQGGAASMDDVVNMGLEVAGGGLLSSKVAGGVPKGALGMGAVPKRRSRKTKLQKTVDDKQKAMNIAQKNAALPIEKGGLGLPPNNTNMDRAKAMGFDLDTPLYHGTTALEDFEYFDPAKFGETTRSEVAKLGVSSSTDAHIANAFAVKDPAIFPHAKRPLSGHRVVPMLHRSENLGDLTLPTDIDDLRLAASLMDSFEGGTDLARLHNYNRTGKPGTVYLSHKPEQLRSPFAAFDPMRKHENNLMAMNGSPLAGLLAQALLARDDN